MEKELQEIGLNANEAKIYLSILKLGEATANRIANLSEIARSTTYDILEKLKHRGLIKSSFAFSEISSSICEMLLFPS